MIEGIDRAIELVYAMNRSDLIRVAIGRQFQEMKKKKNQEINLSLMNSLDNKKQRKINPPTACLLL